jgi:hypothetical protein
MKAAVIHIRINPDLKRQAEIAAQAEGITTSAVIRRALRPIPREKQMLTIFRSNSTNPDCPVPTIGMGAQTTPAGTDPGRHG